MHDRLKISHRRYSGRYLPHKHTSYASLAFLLLVSAVLLASITVDTFAYQYGDPNPPPIQGSVGLSGKVTEPPPKVAAVITSPNNGQVFDTTPITVRGTCPKTTIVELFKNDIFAGSTICQDDGTFKLDIDLLYGSNKLVARVYDALDQAGPDSNIVTVTYSAVPAQGAPIDASNPNNLQMLLHASPVYRGAFPGQSLAVPIEIIGGKPPFALSVDWGDNKTDLISRGDNVVFNASHTYARAGTYSVVLKGTDANGRVAFLTIIIIVNGKAVTVGGTGTSGSPAGQIIIKNQLVLAWPLLAILIIMVTSFWLGERREKHKLKVEGQLITS